MPSEHSNAGLVARRCLNKGIQNENWFPPRKPHARLVADSAGLLAGLLHHSTTASLVDETKTDGLALDLLVSEEGKLLGGLNIGDILNEALGEDDVDFLERSVGSEETSDSSLGDLRRVGTRVVTAGDQETHGQEHGKHLTSGTNEEQLATADTLNEEPGGGSEDGIHNHVDTTEEKSKVLVAKDVSAENGEVVDNSVATSDLLHELRARAEKHTTEVLGLSTGEESLNGSALLGSEARGTDGVDDTVSLGAGLVAVNLVATDGSDDSLGFLVAVVGEQPSRRLGKPDHGNTEDETKDDLEGNGESPCEVLGTVRAAVVDPVGDEGTEGNDTTLDTDEETSVGGSGTLSLVGRDSRGVDTVTNTSDCATNDELRKSRVALHSSNLDNDTNDHDPTTKNHSPSTTEQITDPKNEHGTEQASNLVDSRDETLHSTVLCLGEVIVEGVGVNNSRHDTLIVTKE
ncbi:hypothetical protein HG530_008628 [Fusarium avenaceum]|nr:hypothetical protein HG530_008628 [Fusarium avenaceum]